LINHCLNPANAIAYIRLLLLTAGWIMLEMGSPEIYFAHYVAQMLLGCFELLLLGSQSEPELHKQLRNVLDTIAYAVLLFSVVKSGQQFYGESEPALVNKLTLLHFLVFMSDFVSTWFKNYSIYLAGERKEQATTPLENAITSIWDNRLGRTLAGLFAECFFLYEFIDFNFQDFLSIRFLTAWQDASTSGETKLTDLKDIDDALNFHGCVFCAEYLYKLLAAFMLYRVLVALIELKQGMTRIICLDMEEIAAKRASKLKPASK